MPRKCCSRSKTSSRNRLRTIDCKRSRRASAWGNMNERLRLSQLSPARQALVRALQAVNFGELQNIQVRNGEPMFDCSTLVVLDTKLDKNEGPRPEIALPDFALNTEVSRLMAHLDELMNGTIQRLEVRAGIPRRLVLQKHLPEVRDIVRPLI